MHWLAASGKEMGIGNSLQGPPPSFLLFTDASVTGWGTHLQDLMAAGVWPREERKLQKCFEDEGSLAQLEPLPSQNLWEVGHSRE